MEELFDNQRAATAANHALFAKQGNGGQGGSSRPPPKSGSSTNSGNNGGGSGGHGGGQKGNTKGGKKGNGGSNSNSGGNTSSGATNGGGQGGSQQPFQWRPTFNPWTGMVQAWPMPFHAPGAGVLGPRPGFNPQQAMYTAPGPQDYFHTAAPSFASASSTFDTQALLASLNNAAMTPRSTSEWYVDSGASSHMTGTTHSLHDIRPFPYSSSVKVGNGANLPITHTALSSIPTSYHNLVLRNILLCPELVENLISVRKLTRDNLVSVEFDPFGFSIKDLHTRTVMLRSDSDDDLYPLRIQPSRALHAATTSIDLWHQRLGHPGKDCLLQALRSFNFNCNKTAPHTCHACQLGKHTRLPFSDSSSFSFFPFQLLHAGRLLCLVIQAINIILCFLTITHTMSGRFPCVRRVRSCPLSWHSTHMSPLNIAYPFLRSRLTTTESSTTLPYAPSSPLMASTCVSLVHTRRRKTGRLSGFFAH
jgi:hypothetical protein